MIRDLLPWLAIPGALGLVVGFYFLGRKFGGSSGGFWAAVGAGGVLLLAIIGRRTNARLGLPNGRQEEGGRKTIRDRIQERREARRDRR